MKETRTQLLHRALFRILRPLTRMLLRNGIAYGEFSELVKRAYVQSALEDFPEGRRKTTDSRAAVMTGLTRKEVKRQRELLVSEPGVAVIAPKASRASRVVSGWVHTAHYQTTAGEPAVLPFDGSPSFSELVRDYSGDMTPRAVLDELIRVGVVSVDSETGKLSLRQRAYVPTGDSEEMLGYFGEDVYDLIATIDHNLARNEADAPPLFQRTLTYNNIPPEVMDRWRKHAAAQSQNLLEELDSWLGPYDRDLAQGQAPSFEVASPGKAVRTGVSIFYFEEPVPVEEDQQ